MSVCKACNAPLSSNEMKEQVHVDENGTEHTYFEWLCHKCKRFVGRDEDRDVIDQIVGDRGRISKYET